MASAFELDKEEYKHNFEKEEHGCFISLNSDTVHDFKIDHQAALPVNFIYSLVEETFIQPTFSSDIFTNPDPPQRLYLLNLVFLI